jgi:hypothetical protein
MSGVILVQGFSVTNSLYPDQEKRTMREPEGPNPEVGMKRARVYFRGTYAAG